MSVNKGSCRCTRDRNGLALAPLAIPCVDVRTELMRGIGGTESPEVRDAMEREEIGVVLAVRAAETIIESGAGGNHQIAAVKVEVRVMKTVE